MGHGVSQRSDDFAKQEDRARPSMGQDHRKRARMARADVNEVNVESIYGGSELRPLVQLSLASPPVKVIVPVGNEVLKLSEWRALLPPRLRCTFRPARLRKAPFQISKVRIGGTILEGSDGAIGGARRHGCRSEANGAQSIGKQTTPRNV
jgi:hypothetical protein